MGKEAFEVAKNDDVILNWEGTVDDELKLVFLSLLSGFGVCYLWHLSRVLIIKFDYQTLLILKYRSLSET